MKVSIEGRINVEGVWWDIVTEHEIPDTLSAGSKVGQIVGIIKGLVGTKKIITRVGNIGPPSPAQSNEDVNGGGVTHQAGFTWPAPKCQNCKSEMRASKQQKSDKLVMYFCPEKLDSEEYCRRRASINMETGEIKLWEVRGK